MIELRLCEDRELWDDYILDNRGHPLQLWGWGLLKQKHGWKVDHVIGYDNDEPIAAAMVLTKKIPMPFRAISYVPRGPVGDRAGSNEFLELLAGYMKQKRKPVCLSIEPDSVNFEAPDTWTASGNSILPALTIRLDLTKSESELLSVMAKKTRQYIRKSAADVDVRKVKQGTELDRCLSIYQNTSKRAGFNLHSTDYYHDVFHSMADNCVIYAAYVDEEPVAFLWLAISAETAFELYGGMNETGQNLRANYALKWHAIKEAKSWGLNVYDFGGIIGEGVATFKRSWTNEDTALAGTFDRPLSPFYKLWVKALPQAKAKLQKLRRLSAR